MVGASHLTELHDDVHHISLLVALIVLDDVGVVQAVQHLHLILGLQTMPTPVAAPGGFGNPTVEWGAMVPSHLSKIPKSTYCATTGNAQTDKSFEVAFIS